MTGNYKKRIGLICASVCFLVPILSRIPRGMDWVMHYIPNSLDGFVIELVLASIPPAIVFLSALIARPKFYLPLVLSFLTTVISSTYYHHNYDLSPTTLNTYNLAGIGLVIFSMLTSFHAFVATLIGFGIQRLLIGME